MYLIDFYILGIYVERASKQLENIREWHSGTSHGKASRFVLVSNGLRQILPLQVHEYIPKVPSLVKHILWRGKEKSSFKEFPSTTFGIMDESALIPDLDRYIDDHIPILLQELDRNTLDHVYLDTMHAAYQYQQTGKQGVSTIRQQAVAAL